MEAIKTGPKMMLELGAEGSKDVQATFSRLRILKARI